MTVKEIVIEYLNEHGYDGLFCEGQCSCRKDDLIACDGNFSECEPGYEVPCDGNCEFGGKCEYHISSVKKDQKVLPNFYDVLGILK